MTEDSSTRLNKYLATHAGISRREADEEITKGNVAINGAIAIIGSRVEPGDIVTLRGKSIGIIASTMIALHKPTGYVCSRKQQGDTPTIYSLLPKQYHSLKTAGRLDADSSGLILLTNDGDLSHRLTHPSFVKHKTYLVTLDTPLEPLHRQMIADFGLRLEDGISKMGLTRLHEGNDKEWEVLMTEGRNRQIRRTLAALGYNVTKLHRTQFGNYALGDIKRGEYKELDIS